ncbi:putative ribonuclease H protein [Cardamine amara subsp. amara]|uniref:Ribonuclease H protein n=1 Tax=Cardamine amara subsp. amara TaxID=228776 RepID=A0ABD0ZMN2_CARAN
MQINIPLPPSGSSAFKTRIWKSSIPPKIKHFFWRVLSGAIGSSTELSRRGIPIDHTCQRCSSASESINHLLFECPHSRSVWRQSNTIFSGSQAQDNSLEENIEVLLPRYDRSTSKEIQLLPFWICWQLWKSRNALIFNKEIWSTYRTRQC